MRHAVLIVRKSPDTPATPWRIEYRKDGKRRREYFKTNALAEEALKNLKAKLKREGDEALGLSHDSRIAAMEIEKALLPFKKTLRDAGAFYLNFLNESQRSVTVRALADECLAMKESKGQSAVHLRDLRNRYAVFCADFGDVTVRTLDIQTIERWLNGLKLGPQSVNNYRSRIGALLAYGVKHEYLDKNVVFSIEKEKVPKDDPVTFRPEELSRLLDAATPEMLPLIALGAFSGIRTAELTKLYWSDIDLTGGFVTVRSKSAKTAARRTIKMEPCLIAWLAPFAGRTGPMFTARYIAYFNARLRPIWQKAGMAKWPHNICRHSFASMHYAKYQDASRLAADLGHTTTKLIFSTYRALVRPEVAERYFSIFPPAQAANVLQMAG